MNTTLTFEEGKSRKFYKLELEQNVLTIQFGRIGTAGQTQVKTLGSADAAKKLYDSLLAEKRKKGYVEEPSSGAAPAAEAKSAKGKAAKGAPAEQAPAPEATKKAAAPAARPKLATPALEDPPVSGLDLVVWRKGELPVPQRDATPFDVREDFVVEGYTLTFGEDGELVVTDAKGKKLKSVPDKLRKNEDYQALMRGRLDDRARGARARRVLEERMISGATLTGDELAWLVEDDAFAPLLRGVLVHPVDRPRDAGILLAWDAARGLGVLPMDYDARWLGWATVEVVHPMKLSDVTTWQDLLIDLGIQQELVQLFREVKNVPTAHRNLTESSMLSGRETRSGSAIERSLMAEGWVTRRGMARRKLSVRTGTGVVSVEAWFDYGEYYMPGEPTTTGSFGFTRVDTGKAFKFTEVPAVLVSEAIRSLELCLAQAGAKKDDDEAEEDEAEVESDSESEGGDDSDGGDGGGDSDA